MVKNTFMFDKKACRPFRMGKFVPGRGSFLMEGAFNLIWGSRVIKHGRLLFFYYLNFDLSVIASIAIVSVIPITI